MPGSRGGDRESGPDPLKFFKNIGFLSNAGPDPLKNHKATKPAFNVGPPWARQRKAKWRLAGRPMMARFKWYLDPLSPHQQNKSWIPHTEPSGSAHGLVMKKNPKFLISSKLQLSSITL